ncbi:MAG: MFS transporter [Chromatiales bacterium]|jgi:predicted MFS family arabinose efflux permease|nr:MFS transporter [Chromatiales bacterium]MDX9768666.1 MFS transporter [Ectothiorhodospiraceae bacterium]
MKSGYVKERMTPHEQRVALSLAGVYSVRMLGLFMILPVFSLYAGALSHVTPFLMGMAIGIYGLTQATFQIPLGMLSDRIGRKPVIIGGLLVFALGSVVAAEAGSIWGVIGGRALQGAGAVSAVAMALAADLTREEHRTKVMAVIGFSIGLSFSAALVLGPVLDRMVGVPGIFWFTALLGLIAIAVVLWAVPTPQRTRVHRDTGVVPGLFGGILRDAQLLRLDLGIFVLHMVLTANFVVLPLILRDVLDMESALHWRVYLPVVLLAFVAVVPLIIVAERFRRLKQVFIGAVAVLAGTEFAWIFTHDSVAGMAVTLFVFFAAFNLLEATLPSLMAKLAPPDRKGTAMGVYATTQFLGIFTGGALGGWLYGVFGVEGVFFASALALLVWLSAAATMHSPRYLSSYLLHVGPMDADAARDLVARLTAVRGVAEAWVGEDGVAYLKVDRHALDEARLREFSAPAA